MGVQDRPICFMCEEAVDTDPVYCAPCDHDDCPSASFHGLCLMRWREHREEIMAEIDRFMRRHTEEP